MPYVAERTCSGYHLDTLGDNVKAVLSPAIDEIKGLAGQPVETVLAAVDGSGQISVTALSQSITNVFTVCCILFAWLINLGKLIQSMQLAVTGLSSVFNVASSLQDTDLTGLIGDIV